MQVFKFGGSSLATNARFRLVADLIHARATSEATAVVLSAPQGVTDMLESIIKELGSSHSGPLADRLKKHLNQILDSALTELDKSQIDKCCTQFEQLMSQLDQRLQGATLLGQCPPSTRAQILACGEQFSVLLLTAMLEHSGNQVSHIEPETFIQVDAGRSEPMVLLEQSKEDFAKNYPSPSGICLMPGFYGRDSEGAITTLGRNGSDYSAAILAACSGADVCMIWTDVDGVYNADPRIVDNAQLVAQMSYQEAMELSYFGAKVLHPKTIAPLAQHQIPCLIKNTLSPEAPGTCISDSSGNGSPVKGISNLSGVAMINVSGAAMQGTVGMASRIFSAISQADISVILISQSSSEYHLSFCVPGHQADAAVSCLQKSFNLELKNQLLNPVDIKRDLAVVTLVGDNMQQQKGVAAKFFKALSQVRVNIIAIAQDSSERSISAVIRDQRTDDAVKVCHQNLFLQQPTIDVILLGCGTVGQALVAQLQTQQARLAENNIALNLVAIANSRHCLMSAKGIDFGSWPEALQRSKDSFDLATISDFASDANLSNPVIVDCTSNQEIAMQYQAFLNAGFHVVTANKKANTDSFDYYQKLRQTAQAKQRRFLYETNVGAGLPVIDNLQGLLRAGDQLVQFEGILSGSLSYIFGELHKGSSLSQATAKARELGYTEPNPAEDLSGLDVARKVLVIAREAGLPMELEDIELQGVVDAPLSNEEDPDRFMLELEAANEEFKQRVEQAQQNGQVLRYIASIKDFKCQVGVQAVDSTHALFDVKDGENALAMHTRYYQPRPFVIRGYGAGAEVTAAGLFGDLLRTLAWDNES